jgi:oligopeptide/dipeptide ABC transporter ATP-binding protein
MSEGATPAGAGSNPIVLEADGLTKEFAIGGLLSRNRRVVHALSNVSISVAAGEIVGVVGESGCGKSTLARCLLHLITPTSGQVRLDGQDAAQLLASNPLAFRRAVQIVFQDPYASLNARRTIGQSLEDPLRIFGMKDRARRRTRVLELLQLVGLPEAFASRYPHELSGGQRQRVAIARALAPEPRVIICDEAVSSLDVSIQAQIINLLRDIQAMTNVAYVFISHNLHLVRRICDRVVIMYLGQIVESADRAQLEEMAVHPYSKALFASAPILDRRLEAHRAPPEPALKGEVPSPINLPSGCRFHPRCPYRQDICATTAPEPQSIAGRSVRCHFAVQIFEDAAVPALREPV